MRAMHLHGGSDLYGWLRDEYQFCPGVLFDRNAVLPSGDG